ncbi:DUF2852 domain-containing protein [Sulfitobacter sp. F26169L]|uniref:DUF2852 domain-containing protein n=1 Tax=Sulfitobacter sp. F26169L TaxID=2996015 RepID=UPI002260A72E|nr:DUF2852 domain-containing protein [Sulfitobacter sp. F26169L]MCX7565284.1 DUF2852 domain-containing protein [Sulfitobacter sp. F26169L]
MTTMTDTYPSRTGRRENIFTRSENWLDARGKGAWIAAMVIGFIFFWPVGLALLAYMIWSKRMFSSSSRSCGRKMQRSMAMGRPTGNSAFDAYKADTLRRLEEEQENFESFLERLRASKDKSEFDAFMDERAARNEDKTDD